MASSNQPNTSSLRSRAWNHIKSFFYKLFETAAIAKIIILLASLWVFLVELYEQLSGQISFGAIVQYTLDHPYRIIITAFFLGSLITISIRLFKKVTDCAQKSNIVDGFGALCYWPHDTDERRLKNWKNCIDEITTAPARDLKILGATGWHTFGATDSPLHQIIKEFKGEIRVLLMDPNAQCLPGRAENVGMSQREYRNEINQTIEYCREIQRQNPNFFLKTYSQPPIWKMVIVNQFLWLQHYTKNAHVDDTPVYGLFADQADSSLYYPLLNVFHKRWSQDHNAIVDLASQ